MHSAKYVLSVDETVSTVLYTHVPECTCYKIVKPSWTTTPLLRPLQSYFEGGRKRGVLLYFPMCSLTLLRISIILPRLHVYRYSTFNPERNRVRSHASVYTTVHDLIRINDLIRIKLNHLKEVVSHRFSYSGF